MLMNHKLFSVFYSNPAGEYTSIIALKTNPHFFLPTLIILTRQVVYHRRGDKQIHMIKNDQFRGSVMVKQFTPSLRTPEFHIWVPGYSHK